MEVHHHSHTARKRWTHYFWEFLMLFLAVFCGFLAEYQLEHKIEKDRAREYAELMIEDLNNDSLYIDQLLQQEHFKIKQADSLLALLNSPGYAENNFQLVSNFNHVGTIIDFKPAFPVTFDQMKNSGSLRYIRNKKLVSALSSLNRKMEVTGEVYDGHNQFLQSEFKNFALYHLNNMEYDIFSRRVLVPNPEIFDWDKKEARLLSNRVNFVKTYDLFFINLFLKNCKKEISEARRLIRKEYRLKA